MDAIYINGSLKGYQSRDTYITYRYDGDIFEKFNGFGLSTEIIKILIARNITKVIWRYKGKDGKFDYYAELATLQKSQKKHTNNGDEQIFLSFREMDNKLPREESASGNFLDWNEMMDLIRETCYINRTSKLTQMTFFGVVNQKKNWSQHAISSCLRFLVKKGCVRIGPNMEIILLDSQVKGENVDTKDITLTEDIKPDGEEQKSLAGWSEA